MNRALYIGATSMVANQKRMDVVTNNLANVNTTGYKRDIGIHQSFREVLLAKKSKIPEVNKYQKTDFKLNQENGYYTASVNKGYFTLENQRRKSFEKEIKFAIDPEGYLKTFYNTGKGKRFDYENYILDKNGSRIKLGNDGGGNNIESVLKDAIVTPPPYVIGTLSKGVKFQKSVTDFSPSNVKLTDNPTDFALTDSGFFKVQDEEENIYYTRNGSFGFKDGYLRDADGRYVLVDDAPFKTPTGDYKNFDVMEDGKIYVDDEFLGNLGVVDVANPEMLKKVGNNLYKAVEPSNPNEMFYPGITPEKANIEEIPYIGSILQGSLEESNVNPVSSMVEMIALQRDYDAAQKVVLTSDQMLEKSIELGRA